LLLVIASVQLSSGRLPKLFDKTQWLAAWCTNVYLMSSAPLIAEPNATRPSRASNLARRVALDLCAVFLTAAISLATGLLMNRLSAQRLPIVYQTPEQRLDAELTSLVGAPPFALAPAATIGLAEFRSAVESKNALIFDARPSSFFIQGHVPGALNLARDDFAHDYRRLSGVLKAASNKPIIVYCSGGACHDSRLVANALLTLGFDNVSVFTGGWQAWSAAGMPVSTGAVR
jgi:rhodanese-related sulfurtransferase